MNFVPKSVFFILYLACHGLTAQKNNDTLLVKKIDLYAKNSRNPLQGNALVDFESKLLDDQNIRLSAHKGKVILLNFWFIGCVPCMGEIPDINKIYKNFQDSNVIILSLAKNSVSQVNKFNEGKFSHPVEKIEYPVIPDCEKIAELYGVSGYPTNVLIDKKGIIRLVNSGASIQSLKNYVTFYGDDKLSKDWKKILKEHAAEKQKEMHEFLSELILELLQE